MARKHPSLSKEARELMFYTGPTEDAIELHKGLSKIETQDSKAICEIAYCRNEDESVLYIQFNSDPTIFYRYSNVWDTDIQGLIDAKSKGRFFQKNIRNRYHSTMKVSSTEVSKLITAGTATVLLESDHEEQYLQDHLEGLN